jgi:transcription antitermination protein NusB
MAATRPPRSRRAARKRALDVLYEADLKGAAIPQVLATHLDPDAEDPLPDFSVALVRGVHRHREELDALITATAKDWTLSRMPVIDRNLLRMAIFEILHDPEVPAAVAINEAVDLAKELSTDDSGRFVNGLLGRIAAQHPEPEASA